ncbi:MAG: hypothetical protein J6D04_05040 [Clostridia bacterium]|nr:hypothetical protein [Clostridia bacterium]
MYHKLPPKVNTNVKGFAKKEGISYETSKLGLTEHEAQTLIERYRRENPDSGRGSSSPSGSGRSRREVSGVYENERGTEKSGGENLRTEMINMVKVLHQKGMDKATITTVIGMLQKKERFLKMKELLVQNSQMTPLEIVEKATEMMQTFPLTLEEKQQRKEQLQMAKGKR